MDTETICKREIRERLWDENDGLCAHCGRKFYSDWNKTIDHYIPQSCFGSFDMRNLFPVCKKCNEERGNKLVGMEFYPYCSRQKKQLAIEYGIEYNKQVSALP